MTAEEWQSLLKAFGHPEWLKVAKFKTLEQRLAHIDTLHALIGEWTAQFDDRELAILLQSHGVAAAPVLNVADLLNDPHYKARKTFVEVTHPLGFKETIYGAYVKTSGFEAAVRPGPVIGQDNEHVFKDILGLSETQYQELVERKIIY